MKKYYPLLLLILGTLLLSGVLAYLNQAAETLLNLPAKTEERLLGKYIKDYLENWQEWNPKCLCLSDAETAQQNILFRYQAPMENYYVIVTNYQENGREAHDFHLAAITRRHNGYQAKRVFNEVRLDCVEIYGDDVTGAGITLRPTYGKQEVSFYFGEAASGYFPLVCEQKFPYP